MATQDPGPLARWVKKRRLQLGYTQADLQKWGGPSLVTVRDIEKGRSKEPRGLTLAGLDKALLWTSGSAQVVVVGEPPEELPGWEREAQLREDRLAIAQVEAQGDVYDEFVASMGDGPIILPVPEERLQDLSTPALFVLGNALAVDTGRVFAELARRSYTDRVTQAFQSQARPDDYAAAARSGTPSRVQQEAAEPDPNRDPEGPEHGA